jgi:hypothetical protein
MEDVGINGMHNQLMLRSNILCYTTFYIKLIWTNDC